MQIAYIIPFLSAEQARGGVGSKIKSQVRNWQGYVDQTEIFVLTPDDIDLHDQGIHVFKYSSLTTLPIFRSLARMISRSIVLAQLLESVHVFQPDLIYMRYKRYVYPLHLASHIAPTVVELNTNDIYENRHLGWFHYWFNRATRGLLLRNVAGMVPLSHEIATLSANVKYRTPMQVIANGIDLEQYHSLAAPRNEFPVITLVCTPGMVWHGVDKLIALARRFPDLKINIVGYGYSDVEGDVPSNVRLHGFLDSDDVRRILMCSDVACGTLALHRNNMEEASPLKVREAAAYGIPLLLGYKDTDLWDLECDRILWVPNTENNVEVHADEIRSFAYKMMGKRLDRNIIAGCIDQPHKEKIRLKFFEEIVKRASYESA